MLLLLLLLVLLLLLRLLLLLVLPCLVPLRLLPGRLVLPPVGPFQQSLERRQMGVRVLSFTTSKECSGEKGAVGRYGRRWLGSRVSDWRRRLRKG